MVLGDWEKVNISIYSFIYQYNNNQMSTSKYLRREILSAKLEFWMPLNWEKMYSCVDIDQYLMPVFDPVKIDKGVAID